ncbi:unnamed protein product [Bursaphelenchus okinawaensis]|uniref:Uncharacterized protein n=1 Tax=Bursaphelenchus okinawaensis TaxID=465554 RepID=A0A811LDL7_9BILA|nr:unnamed protein product [Bursaphelenchus okinawaensis]CAG9120497.1 unnamed protein product [Bursaphelenchus okinawaensis]
MEPVTASNQPMEKLLNLIGPDDLEAYYHGNTVFFLDKDVNEIVDLAESCFIKIPSLRDAVMELLRGLVHECSRYSLLHDAASYETNKKLLDESLSKLFIHLNVHIQNIDSDDLRFSFLTWILKVCSELSRCYTEGVNRQVKASEITVILTNANFISELVQLLNSLLMQMLEQQPEKVMERLLDGLQYGVAFDWVFLHVTKTFPFQLIPQLMEIGVKGTAQLLDNESGLAKETDHFGLISDLLLFLSSVRTPKLKSSLVDQLDAYFCNNQHVAHFVFIARLFLKHSEVYGLVGGMVDKFISEANVIRVLKLIDAPYWSNVLVGVDMNNIKFLLQKTSLNGLILLYETLIPLTADKKYTERVLGLTYSTVDARIQLFQLLMTEIFSLIVFELMYNNNLDITTVTRIIEIADEQQIQDAFIRQIIKDEKGAVNVARLFGMVCIKTEKLFSVKALARMLFLAATEEELWNICAFNRVLILNYPLIFTDAVKYIIDNPHEFEHTNEKDLNLVRNLSTLARIQDQMSMSKEEGQLIYGVQFGFVDGSLQVYLVNVLNDRVVNMKNEKVQDFTEFFIEYVKNMEYLKFVDSRRVAVATLTSVIEKWASILVTVIKDLAKELDAEKTTFVIKLLLALIRDYLHNDEMYRRKIETAKQTDEFSDSQTGPSKVLADYDAEYKTEMKELEQWYTERFLQEFLQNIFDASHYLFGTLKGTLESSECLDYIEFPQNLLPDGCLEEAEVPQESRLLEKLRARPMTNKRTAELAHSGVISSVHSKQKPRRWTDVEELRKELLLFIFVNFLEKKEGIDKKKIIIMLGLQLTALICEDTAAGWVGWDSWDTERGFVIQYNNVYKKMEACPIAYELLLYFSEEATHTAVYNCMPLWKSILAVVTNQLGSTPRRTEKLSQQNLEDIAKVLAILLCSGVIPQKYRSLFEILKTLGHYDAYSVMMAFWDLVGKVVPCDEKDMKTLKEEDIQQLFEELDESHFYKVLVPVAFQNFEENAEHVADIIDTFDDDSDEWNSFQSV